MFKRLERNNRFLGYIFENPSALYFFGSRLMGKEDLRVHFPQFEFAFLKQVHGRAVVSADAKAMTEADGHFTSEPRLALVSQTADCIPILLSGRAFVCALHAGWRGVAGQIVEAAKVHLPSPADVVVIGPHIRRNSFEIGRDVADQLLRAKPTESSQSEFVYPSPDKDKVMFDLTGLAKAQVAASLSPAEILDTGDDTKTSDDFHSFRRDRERAGRQYSFVVLKG